MYMKITIHDFIPGGSVLEYVTRPDRPYAPGLKVAEVEGEYVDLSLELTGDLKVESGGKTYTCYLPPQVADAVRKGEVKPLAFPRFALMLVVDDAVMEEVWAGDTLPKTKESLVQWLRRKAEKSYDPFEGPYKL